MGFIANENDWKPCLHIIYIKHSNIVQCKLYILKKEQVGYKKCPIWWLIFEECFQGNG